MRSRSSSIAENFAHIFKTCAKKMVVDKGENIELSPDVMEDLKESIERTISTLKERESKLDEDSDSVKEVDIEQIRDYAGNLALLCNMILNRKSYSQKDKEKAILDL